MNQSNSRHRSGWLLIPALIFILLAVAGLNGPRTAMAKENGGNWKNVTLIYLTDVKGKIEPCG